MDMTAAGLAVLDHGVPTRMPVIDGCENARRRVGDEVRVKIPSALWSIVTRAPATDRLLALIKLNQEP